MSLAVGRKNGEHARRMPPPSPRSVQFTALEWVGTTIASLGAVALLAFPLAAMSFARMFEDLGSRERMPGLTKLATSIWFPLVLAGAVIVMLAVGLRSRVERRRHALLIGALVLGVASLTLCVVGLYLPIFAIAGKISAD